MNTEDFHQNEIVSELAEHGLIGFLAAQSPNRTEDQYQAFLDAVANAVSISNSLSIVEGLDEALAPLSGVEFFNIQSVFVDLIPRLQVGHQSLLFLVRRLVETGGDDLAANRPNSALRDWCAMDSARSSAICADASNGDILAIQHLTFALEGASDVDGALGFLDSPNAEIRRAAVTALGRIQAPDKAEEICERLAAIARTDTDEQTALTALHAGFAILVQNSDLPRETMQVALEERLSGMSDEAVHAAASLLWHHGDELQEDELRTCLDAVAMVRPENTGTIKLIDQASITIAKGQGVSRLAETVRHICDQDDSPIRLKDFDNFLRRTREAGPEVLGRLVVTWFLDGSPKLCADLASTLSDIGRTSPLFSVPADALPRDAALQHFLCRRSVGFLFPSPLSAIVIPITVLRHGDPEIAESVLNLILDPLLLSYGGALRKFLKKEAEEGHPRSKELLELIVKKDEMHETITDKQELVELQPSEEKRQTEQNWWADNMRRSFRAAESKSVIRQIFSEQHLLYGKSSTIYTTAPDGEQRKIEIPMSEHSVSTELALLDILDRVGLAITLDHLKFGPRPQT